MIRIYVAGPMTGIADWNLPAFADATARLNEVGWDAVNPGRRGANPDFTWSDYLRLAITDLVTCDAVALLDGWESSRGARLEVHIATELGIDIMPVAEAISSRV